MPKGGRVRNPGPCAAAGLVGVAAFLLASCSGNGEAPLTGYIEGEYLRVAAPFAGTLQQLAVQRRAQVVTGAAPADKAMSREKPAVRRPRVAERWRRPLVRR